MSNPKPKRGRGTSSPNKKPTCGECGKNHYGDCLIRTNNCFSCGKIGHNMKDFPNLKGQNKGRGQAKKRGSNVDPPKKNCFNDLS